MFYILKAELHLFSAVTYCVLRQNSKISPENFGLLCFSRQHFLRKSSCTAAN
jgi:hypothetical protein